MTKDACATGQRVLLEGQSQVSSLSALCFDLQDLQASCAQGRACGRGLRAGREGSKEGRRDVWVEGKN